MLVHGETLLAAYRRAHRNQAFTLVYEKYSHPRTAESFPFFGRLAANTPPLKSRSFSTQNNDPKGIGRPDMRVSAGTELRETHGHNEAGLLAEVNAHGVAEDPRSQREAQPIPRPHPLRPVELTPQLTSDRLDPAALSHQQRIQLLCSLWLVGASASSALPRRAELHLPVARTLWRTSRFDPVPPNI
jgi:hypothetical protein